MWTCSARVLLRRLLAPPKSECALLFLFMAVWLVTSRFLIFYSTFAIESPTHIPQGYSGCAYQNLNVRTLSLECVGLYLPVLSCWGLAGFSNKCALGIFMDGSRSFLPCLPSSLSTWVHMYTYIYTCIINGSGEAILCKTGKSCSLHSSHCLVHSRDATRSDWFC